MAITNSNTLNRSQTSTSQEQEQIKPITSKSAGANVKAGGSGTSVTLFAPISSTATVDSLAQDEGTAWDGMVVGKTTFTVSLSTGSFAAGTIRIIVSLS